MERDCYKKIENFSTKLELIKDNHNRNTLIINYKNNKYSILKSISISISQQLLL